MKDGILLIDKPAGISSFDVIRQLKKLFLNAGISRKDLPKMGHGGTLDPFATGLLIVLLGEAAKLSRLFLGSVKTYEGEMILGTSTPSGDIDTEVNKRSETVLSYDAIKEAAQKFVNQPYLQKPPMYSAKKINGQKLYELARKNKVVERQAVSRNIYQFEVFDFQQQSLKFKVSCSAGTYVRVLAEDLAIGLGSLAHLKSLRRIASGSFRIDQAFSLERLEEALANKPGVNYCQAFIPLIEVIPASEKLEVPVEMQHEISQGKSGPLEWVYEKKQEANTDVFLTYGRKLLAWVRVGEEVCRYQRVFIKAAELSAQRD